MTAHTKKPGDRLAYPAPFEPYGLTKRELFAAMMMQGLMASDMDGLWPAFANGAVQAADALLAELAKDGAP